MEKKAIIYICLSDDIKENNPDLPFQIDACTEYARVNGYKLTTIQKIYIDDLRNKKSKNQSEFNFALECLMYNRNNIKNLIIYNSNVLPRSKYQRSILFADFKISELSIISVTEGQIELKTNIYILILRMLVNSGDFF